MINEFKEFLFKTNALALAIGVIIGAATGKVVAAVVDDLLMPIIGLVMPAGDWKNAQLILTQATDPTGHMTINSIKYGHFLGAIIDFVIIAFVVFFIAKRMLPKEPPPAATKECPDCLETVPAAARKCKACAAALA